MPILLTVAAVAASALSVKAGPNVPSVKDFAESDYSLSSRLNRSGPTISSDVSTYAGHSDGPSLAVGGADVLGYYASYATVSAETKCYVDDDLVSFVASLGKTMESEYGLNDSGVSELYHYYRVRAGEKKISSVRQMRNDADSLLFMLRVVESFDAGKTRDEIVNDVLGYVRSFSPSYSIVSDISENPKNLPGQAWTMVAGEVNKDFVETVDADDTHGLNSKEYFGQFVEYLSGYNSYFHGSLPAVYQRAPHKNTFLIDPADHSQKIDLIHLFASLDGSLENTYCPVHSATPQFFKGFTTWNGDLQQAANGCRKNTMPPDHTQYLFSSITSSETDYGCSLDDVLADIDAVNCNEIYTSSESWKSLPLSSCLERYWYSVAATPRLRFSSFIHDSVCWSFIGKEASFENPLPFEDEIYFSMDIAFDVNGEPRNRFDDGLYYPFGFVMSGIYDGDEMDKTLPSVEIREYVATSFIRFILNSAGVSA